ncbi:type IV pili methyl-accepting chemotaxis transducer N-terminal domain-containing protein [Yoonia sp. I 8.24]|uniref:type IV pili methyl-accepting chemotaxis transducer N-terminal domain-containing protein n=1 Tax=Yoonia sp. I 8.24 TaxID=1537229 RepID=UPI001EDE91CC|nr:type IV pili methyl-accepting chemotaxis transducer N-terminal domain-containing protein [Yoonia sp. I 8.24]MCG3268686.1 type IV pili methyl-accepting chemotaxis transducer N-terminal domain-containing protein [Yoonia sp. I 8.24]
MLRRLCSGTTLTVAICTTPLTVHADDAADAALIEAQYEIESDGADRIRVAGQLRTLTQQVAAASCALSTDISIDEAHDVLEHATQQFDQYIVALRDGDDTLHILHPETRRRTLEDIAHVAAEWDTIHGAVDSILLDGHDTESAHLIDDHNLELLELTTVLASDITGQYSHPYEITAADAMMIEIAGRQRMLTQKMAKDACEIWAGYHADAAREDLAQTVEVFENSLNALRYGLPAAGLQEAPNDKIRDDLDQLIARWETIKINEQTLIEGGTLTDDQKAAVFHDLEVELAELDHLLDDYKAYAERTHKR